MAGQVVAVASGKGGVGKTTTVVNLGVVLRRADHSVALVDADLGMANLGPMLGVSGELTIHDVLAGTAAIEDALVEEAPGFAVLAGSESLTDYPSADPRQLGELLESLAAEYDFVIVDTGAGMSHEDVLPLGVADRVVLVASPDPAAIGDTRKTAELAGLAEGDIAGLVVTKADAETDVRDVAAQVGVDLLGVIPYDPTVRQSTAAGRPLEVVDPETPAAVAYRDLADALSDGAPDPLQQPEADEAAAADAGPQPDAQAAAEEPAVKPTDDEPDQATPEPESAPPPEEPSEPAPEATAQTDAEPSEDTGGEPSADEPPADDPPSDSAPPEPADDEAPADTTPAADGQAEPAADEPEPEADESEADEAESAEGEEAADAEAGNDAEEEDPLAEFVDDEPESSGGILSRLGRLFR